MKTYEIEVYREERWWMIRVPELDELTQARRVSEIEEMARSLIAVTLEEPLDQVVVRVTKITVPDLGDIAGEALEIGRLRQEADDLESIAASRTEQYAKNLTQHDVPVRDIAELLHVSPQRVSQLANA